MACFTPILHKFFGDSRRRRLSLKLSSTVAPNIRMSCQLINDCRQSRVDPRGSVATVDPRERRSIFECNCRLLADLEGENRLSVYSQGNHRHSVAGGCGKSHHASSWASPRASSHQNTSGRIPVCGNPFPRLSATQIPIPVSVEVFPTHPHYIRVDI